MLARQLAARCLHQCKAEDGAEHPQRAQDRAILNLGGFGGDGFNMGSQIVTQTTAVVIAIVWSAVVTLIALMIAKLLMGGLRVSESAENDGLDLSTPGERASN